ncbi:MAG: hypothetical protein GY724_13950 [Actinomycetia bacterium]|nr:hypothetical protein [Actinomycetes bacterium]MCP4228392.1 hypothetical protein [Actinomycetes bacterium]MCP5031440.1 hypothetical protein [Actinomycetes bacterium]
MTSSNLVVIGHRGAQTIAPENTMAAFVAAHELGADAVELDVHLSRDGVPVVHHDYLVDKTTSGTGPVFDLDWSDLADLDAGSWFDESFRGERIPRLEEVLEIDQLDFEVELKGCGEGIIDRVLAVIDQADALERVEFTSANVSLLVELQRQRPGAQTGLFTPRREPWMTAAVFEHMILGWARFSASQVVHVHCEAVTAELASQLHDLGKTVHANSIHSPADLKRVLELGVDQISADDVPMATTARRELVS